MKESSNLAINTLSSNSYEIFDSTSDKITIHEDLIRNIAHEYLSEGNIKKQYKLTENNTFSLASGEDQLNTEVDNFEKRVLEIFPRKPRQWPKGDILSPLQEWEGYVTEIGKDSFTARLSDQTMNSEMGEEEADFLINDIPGPDRCLLRLGAIFRWVIGYRITPSGTKHRGSSIVFRRLPEWTSQELKENRIKAESLASFLSAE